MDPVTLADYQRGMLRAAFRAAVARGDARPLLVPACIIPSFIVPAVFLAVAGRYKHLQPLRYTLAAAIVALNFRQLGGSFSSGPTMSSLNLGSSYGTGLILVWGSLWAMTVLVWMNPWSGERIARKKTLKLDGSVKCAPGFYTPVDEDVARSLRQGHEYYWQSFPANGPFWARFNWTLDLCLSWRGVGWSWCKTPVPHFAPPTRPHTDELVQLDSIPEVTTQGYRRYSRRSTFYRARLIIFAASYLILDICATIMTQDPYFVLGPPPDSVDGIRSWSEQIDQYPGGFLPPPPALLEVPSYLDTLYKHYPTVLALYHSVLGTTGIVAALSMLLSLGQIVRVYLGSSLFSASSVSSMSTATQLWHNASPFGSVNMLLDHSLAGFWGGWWHQTFRMAFVAPTNWLIRHGVLPGEVAGDTKAAKDANDGQVVNGVNGARDTEVTENIADKKAEERTAKKSRPQPVATRIASLTIAFSQSALLHAAASITSLPSNTKWWLPTLFFLLSGVGIVIQTSLQAYLLKRFPRPFQQVVNLAFALGWLHATQWLFIDDLARSGVWLYEPVPFSFVRLLIGFVYGDSARSSRTIFSPAGSSRAGHAAWRWYSDDLAHWHSGPSWWESGLAP